MFIFSFILWISTDCPCLKGRRHREREISHCSVYLFTVYNKLAMFFKYSFTNTIYRIYKFSSIWGKRQGWGGGGHCKRDPWNCVVSGYIRSNSIGSSVTSLWVSFLWKSKWTAALTLAGKACLSHSTSSHICIFMPFPTPPCYYTTLASLTPWFQIDLHWAHLGTSVFPIWQHPQIA